MVRPDGSDLIQLTNDSKRELLLYWLRDGSRLLFIWSDAVDPNDGRGHVASVLPDGSDRKELGRVQWMPSEPAVSPDGRRVAFGGDADPDGGSGIVLLDLVSGTRSRLTSDGAYAPRWSPDGTRLLAGVLDRVLVLDATSGKRLAKIDDPGFQETIGWTPDGASILYKSCLPQMNKLECMANPVAIADSDGSNLRPFTGDPPSPVNWIPSPDGAWLAVGEDDGTTYLAAVADPDARVALATGGAPAWSPDSAWLALAAPIEAQVPSDESPQVAVWVVPRAGGTPTQITTGPNDAGAAWSPR